MELKIVAFLLLAFSLSFAVADSHKTQKISDLPGGAGFKGLKQDVTSHSGYITVNPKVDANLFYWCFESQNNPATDPFIVWLTGGPGCSSILALTFENGPFTVNGTNTSINLVPNAHGWNNKATVCWVDQPAGTGYSFTKIDYIHNEAGVQTEMWTFFNAFFKFYPQYQGLDFFLSGESYGGHYVPAISAYIVSQQSSGSKVVNFKGASIGNGWVAPIIQFGAYAPFALANNLITSYVDQQMNSTYQQCYQSLESGKYGTGVFDTCESIMNYVLQANPGLNYYNIHTECNGPLCYNFDLITFYLNENSTKTSLGVPQSITWQACDSAGNPFIPYDELKSFAIDVPATLAGGVQVLVYSGMYDLICNYYGGNAWTSQLQWPGQSGFNSQQMANWKVGSVTAGSFKSYSNLTWLEVEAAGHMVPHDQPANALAMINTFISGQSF